jgi:hypothetical protein
MDEPWMTENPFHSRTLVPRQICRHQSAGVVADLRCASEIASSRLRPSSGACHWCQASPGRPAYFDETTAPGCFPERLAGSWPRRWRHQITAAASRPALTGARANPLSSRGVSPVWPLDWQMSRGHGSSSDSLGFMNEGRFLARPQVQPLRSPGV